LGFFLNDFEIVKRILGVPFNRLPLLHILE